MVYRHISLLLNIMHLTEKIKLDLQLLTWRDVQDVLLIEKSKW